jgi:regulator of RNase E activity RraB
MSTCDQSRRQPSKVGQQILGRNIHHHRRPELRSVKAQMHPDDEVLADLQRHGSDLSAEHTLEHYLYFQNATAASEACAELEAGGFRISRSGETDKPNSFLVLATISLVPKRQNVIALSDQLEALALKFGGEYDGWEAAIIRNAS